MKSERTEPVAASPLRDLGLRDAGVKEIFAAACIVDSIILTKDSDFVRLLEQEVVLRPKTQLVYTGSRNIY